MSDEFPPSAIQRLIAALLGDDGPIAVLLKDIRDSNRKIETYLRSNDVTYTLNAPTPPVIREQIKGVMIALLRGDVSSETATDRIMEVINGRR